MRERVWSGTLSAHALVFYRALRILLRLVARSLAHRSVLLDGDVGTSVACTQVASENVAGVI